MSENTDQPLVSILTPVYNGEQYLRDCIDSVLAQDYQNWEYHIVNNCSTDGTLQLARSYAAKEPRIRVSTNPKFLSMPGNFNHAFSLISPASRYVKVVCADDWIMPDCIGKLVQFAVRHPSVGILCCHQRSGSQVRWADLPDSVNVLSGREACRMALLKGARIFGAPTAFMYRADLMRLGKPFFPNDKAHSDSSACYEFLERCDYGVVHEVLAVERVHSEQISSKIETLAAGDLAYLEVVLLYGPRYLTPDEFRARSAQVLDAYYRGLGGAALKLRRRPFWDFQRMELRELGHDLDRLRVAKAAITEALVEARHPAIAMRKVSAALRDRLSR